MANLAKSGTGFLVHGSYGEYVKGRGKLKGIKAHETTAEELKAHSTTVTNSLMKMNILSFFHSGRK